MCTGILTTTELLFLPLFCLPFFFFFFLNVTGAFPRIVSLEKLYIVQSFVWSNPFTAIVTSYVHGVVFAIRRNDVTGRSV